VVQLVPPTAQLCVPTPLVTAHARAPLGLEHARVVTAAPHTLGLVGVHAWVVASGPQLPGTPAGVQLCEAGGAAPTHDAAPTTSPKLFMQVLARVWTPLSITHVQLAERDSTPLPDVKPQVAPRTSVPAPLHTSAAEQAPHASYAHTPLPPPHAPHDP
jgi:hypothetical protein